MYNLNLLNTNFKYFCLLILFFCLCSSNLYAQNNKAKLLENLYSEDKTTRETAAKKLGMVAFQPLISILQNKTLKPTIRASAIASLAEIRTQEAQPYLIEALNDESVYIRSACIESLKRLEYYNLKNNKQEPTTTIPKLILMLEDPHPKVRINVIRSLSELYRRVESLNPDDIVPHLILMTADEHLEVRMATASALGDFIHYACILTSFKEKLGDSNFKKLIDNLLFMLEDKEQAVVRSTLLALNKIQVKEVMPKLIELLNSNDPLFRLLAAENLGDFGDKEAITHLIPLLEDKEEDVRKAAKEALNKLAGLAKSKN